MRRSIEERVTGLDRELRKMRSELKAVRKGSQRPWWERRAGRFKHDPLFDEVVKAGRTYRRALTLRAR